MSHRPEVLVVDDESRLAELFATWLEPTWNVETAYDGDEVLEKMDDSVEIVLLDRRMPRLSGDEALEMIRENGYECPVIMVTAVDPDFDIIEMGFDGYLVKPVSKTELVELIETVLTRATYASAIREYYAMVSKKSLLEVEKTEQELADHEEYQQLRERVAERKSQVDGTISSLSTHDEFVAAFEEL